MLLLCCCAATQIWDGGVVDNIVVGVCDGNLWSTRVSGLLWIQIVDCMIIYQDLIGQDQSHFDNGSLSDLPRCNRFLLL